MRGERGRKENHSWIEGERREVAEWAEIRKQRDIKWKGREVHRTSMARALSPVPVTTETAAHISTSPRESKRPPGENEGREVRSPKSRASSPLMLLFAGTWGIKRRGGRGSQGGAHREQLKEWQRAAVAPIRTLEESQLTGCTTARKIPFI